MLFVALCKDAPDARDPRMALFAPHMDHGRRLLPNLRLACPLAERDDVNVIAGDEGLIGSVYVLETATDVEAGELMAADPYVGPVWSGLDLYRWENPEGAWHVADRRPDGLSANYRCYAVKTYQPSADALYSAISGFELLMGGQLTYLRSWGQPVDTVRALDLLRAADLQQVQDAIPSTDSYASFAIPVATGSWVGVKNL